MSMMSACVRVKQNIALTLLVVCDITINYNAKLKKFIAKSCLNFDGSQEP